MPHLDISVKGNVGSFTKRVTPLGVSTQILLKIPKHDMTAVRLVGEVQAIKNVPEVQAHHHPAIKSEDKPTLAVRKVR